MHAVIDARTDQQGVERLDAPATRSPPQHWLAIINPSAGHHTNGWLWKMGRRMQRELGRDVAITRNYAQIAEVLRVAGHADGIAVCGIAEAVNHMRLDRQHLLVLPGGTGNRLARDLGIASVDHALAARRADRRHTIDPLQVTFDTPYEPICRLMVSTLSLGYAADTVVLAGRLPQALASLRYVSASIMQTTRMPHLTLDVEIDGTLLKVRLTNLM